MVVALVVVLFTAVKFWSVVEPVARKFVAKSAFAVSAVDDAYGSTFAVLAVEVIAPFIPNVPPMVVLPAASVPNEPVVAKRFVELAVLLKIDVVVALASVVLPLTVRVEVAVIAPPKNAVPEVYWFPCIAKVAEGVVVPTPTLPLASMRMRSVSLVKNSRGSAVWLLMYVPDASLKIFNALVVLFRSWIAPPTEPSSVSVP